MSMSVKEISERNKSVYYTQTKNEMAVEFTREREHERFASITFVMLIVLNYKRA